MLRLGLRLKAIQTATRKAYAASSRAFSDASQSTVETRKSESSTSSAAPTKVLTWGSDAFGGLGDDSGALFRTTPQELLFDADATIIQVSSRAGSNLALSSDGRVYVWGYERATISRMMKLLEKSPKLVQFARRLPFWGMTTAPLRPVPERLYPFGSLDEFRAETKIANAILTRPFSPVVEDAVRCVKVVAGQNASAAITADGGLFTWSTVGATSGMLGHGESVSDVVVPNPSLVQSLTGTQIVDVALGLNHLVALDADGKVYSSGYYDHGALGLPVSKTTAAGQTQNTPKCVQTTLEEAYAEMKMFKNVTATALDASRSMGKVIQVAAGNRFSVFLSENGSVWTTGEGRSGELGLLVSDAIDRTSRHIPHQVISLRERHVVKVSAGPQHVIALDDEGQVWTWGSNSFGQCGRMTSLCGTASAILPPGQVYLSEDMLKDAAVVDVIAGAYESVIVLSDGRNVFMGSHLHKLNQPRAPYVIEEFEPASDTTTAIASDASASAPAAAAADGDGGDAAAGSTGGFMSDMHVWLRDLLPVKAWAALDKENAAKVEKANKASWEKYLKAQQQADSAATAKGEEKDKAAAANTKKEKEEKQKEEEKEKEGVVKSETLDQEAKRKDQELKARVVQLQQERERANVVRRAELGVEMNENEGKVVRYALQSVTFGAMHAVAIARKR